MTPDERREFERMAAAINALQQDAEQDMKNEKVEQARAIALMTIARELSIRAGLKPEEFDQHFEVRYQFWYDWLLRKAEDVSQTAAAALDVRTDDEDFSLEQYPLLFPEQSEES